MYLKALEIQGFKSFADKTRLEFDNDITMIVGPNGSGKSNISDAILWVLGEQRTKSLRGAKMEDVIFGGTQKRNPLGFAQVSLYLDNTDRIFPVETDELVVTRRYYRSGDSEYMINRQACRLKDINELFMDTGLGRDGYSVIGQGRIAEIVSAKSTERREIFDEAAGISRYRYRKEEAEHKLLAAEDSLLRIGDKISELELQVGPLKKQSETAKKYLELSAELKGSEITVWLMNLERLQSQSASVRESLVKAQDELAEITVEQDRGFELGDSITEQMQNKDREAEKVRTSLSLLEADIAENDSNAAVLKNQKQSNLESAERVREDLAQDDKRIAGLDAQIEALEVRVREISGDLRELKDQADSLMNIINGHKMKMGGRESKVSTLRDQLTSATVEERSVEARVHMLSEMQKEYEGFSKSVRSVMRESSHGTLRGIHGPVADLVRAEDRFALAVETALGYAAQNIVVDTQDDGKAAIEYLKRSDSGRATFLPLNAVRGKILTEIPEKEYGYLGLAYDLVSFEPRYENIFANLLGKTIVTETLSDAVSISRKYDNRFRIVSLDGQMINAGGSMTGGSAAKGTGMLSRANELERLQNKKAELVAFRREKEETLQTAERELAAARFDMETASTEYAELSAKLSSLEAERAAKRNNISQLEEVKDALLSGGGQRRALIEDYARRNRDIDSQLEVNAEKAKELQQQAQAKKDRITQITSQKMALEAKRTQNDRDNQLRNEKRIDLERLVGSLERKTLAADLEEQQIADKLWENYELTPNSAKPFLKEVQSLSSEEKVAKSLKHQISMLGPVNLAAIDDYERVAERYEDMTGQRDDIVKAKNELMEIIHNITTEMETIFTEEFSRISECFTATFLELFGGGRAVLALEDKEDPLNCGIEIKVQPPGKAVSNISLLSGGEKAFVAIALYFSILRVKPTPFCLMDEIEAALDEENVARYSGYLKNLSENTQFIVITHRRGTMENAGVLFGVTMQEKGVSRVIRLNLKEATEMASDKLS